VEDRELDEVVRRCPTGSLAYQVKDGSSREEAEAENTVTIAVNGPAYIRGKLVFEGDEGEGATEFRAALCRCGHSKNKPFCDNSHLKAKFRDTGAVGREGPGFEEEGGTLTITAKENGSLRLRGNVSIRSASGTIRWRGSKVSLCRCGLSESKPFCDGSHRKGNFEADGFVKAAAPKPGP
jgi:CDGSH-type Zn-finger protein